MRAFLVLALVTMAVARPEAGYSYQQPQAQAAVPAGSYGGPGFGGNIGISGGNSGFGGVSSGSFANSVSSGGFVPSSGGFSNGGFSSGHGAGNLGGGFSGAHHGGNLAGGFSQGGNLGGGFGGAQGGNLAGGFGGGFSTGGAGETIIHKHIYVHEAPAEPEEVRPQRHYAQGPAQKHYKIVFIKAPTAPTPTVPAISGLPAQNEEKTLIYVLVKKPEEAPEFTLPTAAPTQPSKPEVFFIKYKAQKEGGSAGVISNGSDGGLAGLGGAGIVGLGSDAGSHSSGSSHSGQFASGAGQASQGSAAPSGNYGAPGASGPY